jgi:hypothetical protein
MTYLDSLRKTLSTEEGCIGKRDPDCSAIMLGILIREQHKLSRLDPPMVAPCNGYSISRLIQLISQFPDRKTPQVIQSDKESKGKQRKDYPTSMYYSSPRPEPESEKPVVDICTCTFKRRFGGAISTIEREIGNFKLTVQK